MAGLGFLKGAKRMGLLALCGGLLAIAASNLLKNRGLPDRRGPGGADITAEDVRYIGKKGKIQWELEVGKMQHWFKEGVTAGRDLRMVFTLEDGRRIRARADRGRAKRMGEGFVELQGDVIVELDGWCLQTEALRYDPKRGLLETTFPVEITREGLNIRGRGMKMDLQRGTVSIRGKVQVVLKGEGWEGWP
ncbi:MAG: LPS export ABC transporter periplasmic protein LptC [Deltaproteobacteria bacterium]|nr:MAG: LPS export ABC transporter periplasmic protein LptC [Deltaproteobacteria bacterium]